MRRYFTDSPYERLMQELPEPAEKELPEPLPKDHPCYGCGRASEPCILPCYRIRYTPEKKPE